MGKVGMRFCFVVCLTVILCSPSSLPAAQLSFFNMSTVRHESVRLGTETKALVSTPFDVKNGGIWGALAATGATAVAYIFDQDIRGNLADSRSSSLDSLTEAGSLVGNPFLHLGIAGAVYSGGVVAESSRYRDLGLMLGEAAILAPADRQGEGQFPAIPVRIRLRFLSVHAYVKFLCHGINSCRNKRKYDGENSFLFNCSFCRVFKNVRG